METSEPPRLAETIIAYKLAELTDTQLDEVLLFIETIQDRDDTHAEDESREGIIPPVPNGWQN
jgi:hypothetical protein